MAIMQCRFPVAGLAIILCATSAWGQQSNILQANIPFPFQAGETHFAAGSYDVAVGSPYLYAFTVKSKAGVGAMGAFFWDKRQNFSALESKLVFTKYGKNEYFLSEIWHPWVFNSMRLWKSKREVVTSKLVAGLRPEKVEILAAVRVP